MEIKSISKNLFGIKRQNLESNQTNPFGVNYKGNMINADVFDVSFTGGKEKLIEKAAKKGKMWASAMVSSINEGISSRLDSIARFGSRMKENTINLWNSVHNFDFASRVRDLGNSVKSTITAINEYSTNNLLKCDPVDFIESRFVGLVRMREAAANA